MMPPGRIQTSLKDAQSFLIEILPLLDLGLALGIGESHAINNICDPFAFPLAAKHAIAMLQQAPDECGEESSQQRDESQKADPLFSLQAGKLGDRGGQGQRTSHAKTS